MNDGNGYFSGMDEETALERLVRLEHGNKTRAARRMGVSRQSLIGWLKNPAKMTRLAELAAEHALDEKGK